MTRFSVSPNPARYRIDGPKEQRYVLPPSSGVALGEGLLFGLPGGVLLALPVALRANGDWRQTVLVWVAALGLYGMLLGVLAAALRMARPLPRHFPALLLGLGFAFGPLAQFGTLLVKQTHHRPLGAATYAVTALAVIAIGWAVASRVLVSVQSAYKNRRRFGWCLVAGAGISSLAFGVIPVSGFFRRFGQDLLLSSLVVDGLLGLALAMLGGFAQFPAKLEATARTLGPIALGVCILAFAVAMQSPLTGPAFAGASVLWAWLG